MKIAAALFVLTIAALLANTQTAASADDGCAGNVAFILRQAYPSARDADPGILMLGGKAIALRQQDDDGNPHAVFCRLWPADPKLMLVAVPLIKTPATSDYENEGDLELLVVDAASQEVRQRLLLADRMSDDAVGIYRVEFDTARYRIRKGRTAFGLRITMEGSSRPNPFREVNLSLYTVEDGKLRQILDGLVVSSATGEWDTRCSGTFTETDVKLAMGPPGRDGYADIVAKETTSTRTTALDATGECNDQSPDTRTSTYRIVHDGDRYELPTPPR